MARILVTYASAAGSTAEVARSIGETLRESGAQVDVMRAKEAPKPEAYDAVVLGSGVRAFKTYAEVRKYVKAHQAALARVPVATFVLCGAMKDDTQETRAEALKYANTLLAGASGIEPVSVGLFGGAVDYDRLDGLTALMMKKVFKDPGGDYRDWDKIRSWAQSVAVSLIVSVAA